MNRVKKLRASVLITCAAVLVGCEDNGHVCEDIAVDPRLRATESTGNYLLLGRDGVTDDCSVAFIAPTACVYSFIPFQGGMTENTLQLRFFKDTADGDLHRGYFTVGDNTAEENLFGTIKVLIGEDWQYVFVGQRGMGDFAFAPQVGGLTDGSQKIKSINVDWIKEDGGYCQAFSVTPYYTADGKVDKLVFDANKSISLAFEYSAPVLKYSADGNNTQMIYFEGLVDGNMTVGGNQRMKYVNSYCVNGYLFEYDKKGYFTNAKYDLYPCCFFASKQECELMTYIVEEESKEYANRFNLDLYEFLLHCEAVGCGNNEEGEDLLPLGLVNALGKRHDQLPTRMKWQYYDIAGGDVEYIYDDDMVDKIFTATRYDNGVARQRVRVFYE